MGWPDGALRIMPGIESHFWGVTLSWNVLIPIIILPGLMFTILMMLPFIEGWITRTSGSTTCSSGRATRRRAPR